MMADGKRGRPKKDEVRERVSFTTLPKIIEFVHEERGFMAFSEFIHRALVDLYNKKNPDNKIEYWKP